MTKAAIECINFQLKFEKERIFNPASFTIPAGAFVGIIGINGAGKTSLLKSFLAIHSNFEGKILFFGEDQPLYMKKGRIGYLPQSLSCVPLKVKDFLDVCIHQRRACKLRSYTQRKNEVERVLALVDALGLMYKDVSHLSGGERQKVFLAQALLCDPKILVLDEPFSSMDPAQTHEMIKRLEFIQSKTKVTIVCATHQPFTLKDVLTHILYIQQNNIIMGESKSVLTPQIISEIYDIPLELIHRHSALA